MTTVKRAGARHRRLAVTPVLMCAILGLVTVAPDAAVAQAGEATPQVGGATATPPPTPLAAPSPAPPPPAAPVATPAATPAPMRGAPLAHELSPVGMFMSADIVVKGVMIGLLLASIAVWTTWLAKTIELWGARRRLSAARDRLARERTLVDIDPRVIERSPVAARLVAAAERELALSSDVTSRGGLLARVDSRLSDVSAAAARSMRRGAGLLASVGASAPFIGLFGTVWGIMNSFIGISKSQTTNLAVVAPGIAEALLATAIGLVAAIPAVLLFNQLNRSIAEYKALVGETAAEVERLVSRDLDRSLSHGVHVRARNAAE